MIRDGSDGQLGSVMGGQNLIGEPDTIVIADLGMSNTLEQSLGEKQPLNNFIRERFGHGAISCAIEGVKDEGSCPLFSVGETGVSRQHGSGPRFPPKALKKRGEVAF
jgi:hypothetical protein